ncbi:uncharacterized protein LOC108461799 [Gossypium arboreum]|uniref:uncharacterized protein LOC108461799 n=1 Tax=Gossypium arboreum TaxID=29729 RepID=UPI0022F1BD62|nr:uncharacterized protein LOC108461799 [Gossypium arboreum]
MEDGLGQSPTSAIRRRNSITTPVQIPTKLTLLIPKPLQTATSLSNGSATAPLPLDLELISLKASFASYTSLKDILPSPAVAVNSPTAAGSATSSGLRQRLRIGTINRFQISPQVWTGRGLKRGESRAERLIVVEVRVSLPPD